jgi:hypothetical protein
MAYPRNFFEENWVKEMSQLLEKARYDLASYEKTLSDLEKRYHLNNQDPLVRNFVEQLRRKIWPQSQQEASLLNVISPNTFQDLKSNYDKFKNSSLNGPKQEN